MKTNSEPTSNPISHWARGIIDISQSVLVDRPDFLEEKLLKTKGVFAAEINVFSNRIIVEFDPTLINLDMIRAMIKSTDDT